MTTSRALLGVIALLLLGGCQSMPKQPIATEDSVNIERFMGRWYVIAHIPTFIEKEAWNATETYSRDADGRIQTVFRFRKGGFDGPVKTYTPNGVVKDESGAIWGMQFIWPFRADYRIVHVDDGYEETVIGRQKRDYVWIMTREPQVSDGAWERLTAIVAEQGYDLARLRRVPQRWPEAD